MTENLKVNETVNETVNGRCDFCQVNEPKHTINGGLWWVCDKCMNKHYDYDAKLSHRFPTPGEDEEE